MPPRRLPTTWFVVFRVIPVVETAPLALLSFQNPYRSEPESDHTSVPLAYELMSLAVHVSAAWDALQGVWTAETVIGPVL